MLEEMRDKDNYGEIFPFWRNGDNYMQKKHELTLKNSDDLKVAISNRQRVYNEAKCIEYTYPNGTNVDDFLSKITAGSHRNSSGVRCSFYHRFCPSCATQIQYFGLSDLQ